MEALVALYAGTKINETQIVSSKVVVTKCCYLFDNGNSNGAYIATLNTE